MLSARRASGLRIGALAALLRCSSEARADGEPAPDATTATTIRLDTIEVEAPRERAAAQEAEAPGFLTVVEAGRPSARVASAAELLETQAGVRVRSIGGPGTFAQVSVRGSDAAEVAVFLDGVPLNRAGVGVVDLAQVPVDAIERVEIWRGFVPPELGAPPVGGAINLISRRGARAPAWRASIGGGTLGMRSAMVGYGFGSRALRADASASYRGGDGRFYYYYDESTNTPSDDKVGERRNNGFDQGAVDLTLGGERARARWSAGVHAFFKDQGVAGRYATNFVPVGTARLRTERVIADTAVEQRGLGDPDVDLRVGLHAVLQRQAFDNRARELVGSGVPERSESLSLEGGFDARLQAATAFDVFSILLSGSLERYEPRDLLGARTQAAGAGASFASDRRRVSLTIADDIRLWDERVAIAPSLRFDAIDDHFARDPLVFGGQAAGQDAGTTFLSPQLGLRVRPTGWLQLKGSVRRAVRAPTLLELFGDRAFILPRPGLRPEIAAGGDVGAEVDLRRGPVAVALQAAFFGRLVDDYIALLRTTYASSYNNIGRERFLGAEVRARLRLGAFALLTCDYTFVRTINETEDAFAGSTGKALPGVPAHKLDLHAEGSLGPFTLFYDLAFASEVYLTAQMDGGAVLAPRALHAIGLRAGPFPGWPVRLAVEIANLADVRVVDRFLGGSAMGGTSPAPLLDFQDYPLPGRTVFVTLDYHP